MAPVPLASRTKFALVTLEETLFPESVICCPNAEVPYNSVKLSFILLNAVLNGSPVPSLAAYPIPIVCCAIY